MTNLIDQLPLEVLKALAKRYKNLKLPNQNLMSVQEDFARAAGHRDMHAAQAYWERKLEEAKAQPPQINENSLTVDDLIKDAAHRATHTFGWVSIDTLTDVYLNSVTFYANEVELDFDVPTIEEARDQVKEAIKDLSYFNCDLTGARVTTRHWAKMFMDELPRAATRRDPKGKVEDVKSDVPSIAVDEACSDRMVVPLQGEPGAGTSMVLKSIARVHEDAGWQVIASGLSWTESEVMSEIIGLSDQKSYTVGALVAGSTTQHTDFSKPTLVLLNGAEHVPAMLMAELVQAASRAEHPVKIVAVGSSDLDRVKPYNGFSAIAKGSRVVPIDKMIFIDAWEDAGAIGSQENSGEHEVSIPSNQSSSKARRPGSR